MDTPTLTDLIEQNEAVDLALARVNGAAAGLEWLMIDHFTTADPATDAVRALVETIKEQLDRLDDLHGRAAQTARALTAK